MKKLFTLLIILCAALSVSAADYDLWICGMRVNSANKGHIISSNDTRAVYNSDTKTLTLTDLTYNSTDQALIKSGIDGLKIKIVGTCTLNTSGNANTIYFYGKTTFTGDASASLTLKQSSSNTGYQPIRCDADFTIENIKLNAISSNSAAVSIYNVDNPMYSMTIKDANATFTSGPNYNPIRGLKSITTTDCSIQPGYLYNTTKNRVVNSNGDVITNTSINFKCRRYGNLFDVAITDKNANNITSSAFTGTAYLNRYGDTGNVYLSLNNVVGSAPNYSHSLWINPDFEMDTKFDIHFSGTCKFTGSSCPIFVNEGLKEVNFRANATERAKLIIQGTSIPMDIRCNEFSFVNLDVTCSGKFGIEGFMRLDGVNHNITFNNSTLYSTCTSNERHGALGMFINVKFIDSYLYTTSSEKYNNTSAYAVCTPDGSVSTTVEIGRGYGIRVNDKDVTSSNKSDVLGDGKVSYDSSSKILTLNGVNITSSPSAIAVFTPITINTLGTNTIKSTAGRGLYCTANTTIKSTSSSSSINFTTEGTFSGIEVNQAALTLQDCQLAVYAPKKYGIEGTWTIGSSTLPGTSSLNIKNASVIINNSSEHPCIRDMKSFSMTESYFEQPLTAEYKSYGIFNNGEFVKGNLEIRKGYGIIVAGTRVTKDNASNVMSGVSYDASSNTLKLNGCNITTDTYGIVSYKDLNLYVSSTANTITSTKQHGILAYGNLDITGSGKNISKMKLAANWQGNSGIYMKNASKKLSMKNTTWDVRGTSASCYGIYGNSAAATIQDAELTAYGSSGSIYSLSSLSMTNVEIVTPEDAVFTAGKGITVGGSVVSAKDVKIGVKEYGVSVCGTKITTANRSDLFKDGKVSYDSKNKILTLNNYTGMSEGNCINAELDGPFTINLKGSNSLWSSKSYAIYYKHTGAGIQPLNITSSTNGSIRLQADSRAATYHLYGGMRISNCTVEANGYGAGLAGANASEYSSNSLSITNADVKAHGTSYAVFYQTVNLTDCHVDTPANATFDNSMYSYVLNGNYCKDIHIVPGTAAIEGVTLDEENDANAPVYDLRGVQVDKSYKGVVIKNGKKYMQK